MDIVITYPSGTADRPTARGARRSPRCAAQIAAIRDSDAFDVRFVRARGVIQRVLGDDNGSSALADKLSTIAAFGAPADFYDKLATQTAALSTRQVRDLRRELGRDDGRDLRGSRHDRRGVRRRRDHRPQALRTRGREVTVGSPS